MPLPLFIKRLVKKDSNEIRLSQPEKDKALIQLQAGYHDITQTVQGMAMRMELESSSREKMLNLLQSMPDKLEQIPQAVEAQRQMHEVLEKHFIDYSKTNDDFTKSLVALTETSQSQEINIAAIQTELENARSEAAQARVLMRQFNQRLDKLTEQNEEAANHLQLSADNNQRKLTAAIAATWAMAGLTTVALGSGAYMYFNQSGTLEPSITPVTDTTMVKDSFEPIAQPAPLNSPLPDPDNASSNVTPIEIDQDPTPVLIIEEVRTEESFPEKGSQGVVEEDLIKIEQEYTTETPFDATTDNNEIINPLLEMSEQNKMADMEQATPSDIPSLRERFNEAWPEIKRKLWLEEQE